MVSSYFKIEFFLPIFLLDHAITKYDMTQKFEALSLTRYTRVFFSHKITLSERKK